jgi:hypothetical protein
VYPSGVHAPDNSALDAQTILWGYLLGDGCAVLRILMNFNPRATCDLLHIVCKSLPDSMAEVVVGALWEVLVCGNLHHKEVTNRVGTLILFSHIFNSIIASDSSNYCCPSVRDC